MKNNYFLFFLLLIIQNKCFSQAGTPDNRSIGILPGAERMSVYIPMLKGRTVAVFANQTSMVRNMHLVDALIKEGIAVRKIFAPEHGFRGVGDAGEGLKNGIDSATGISVISLYGSKLAPSADDLKDVDIMIFDVQDVGVRFYTYISSLQKYMEAAMENHKPLLILDRPNPNGFYVDGPVLDIKFASFVGMQPVPAVYGMTIGEYAFMIAGEKWLSEKANEVYSYYQTAQNSTDTPFHFLVIRCANYTHKDKYILPVNPSPNLQNMQSVYLYPSLCFFEGTAISLGRGTDKPFEQFGHPSFPKNLYSFIPQSRPGAKNPPLLNQTCYGFDLTILNAEKEINDHLQLKWLIKAYELFPDKAKFFLASNYFNKLAGTDMLMQQIKDGKTENEIRKSWQPALNEFKRIRKKYLLYGDFE
ncbi:MAG TPA: DUF1343 domain-containing protein [Puia sp.]|nr:DUF1343 domain-containing protein [Puia sp.]